jgi:hypothetical protein
MRRMGGIPLSEWSGSGATERLHQTIRDFNKVTTKQTDNLVRLTRQLVILTWVLCIGLVVQVALAIFS